MNTFFKKNRFIPTLNNVLKYFLRYIIDKNKTHERYISRRYNKNNKNEIRSQATFGTVINLMGDQFLFIVSLAFPYLCSTHRH